MTVQHKSGLLQPSLGRFSWFIGGGLQLHEGQSLSVHESHCICRTPSHGDLLPGTHARAKQAKRERPLHLAQTWALVEVLQEMN